MMREEFVRPPEDVLVVEGGARLHVNHAARVLAVRRAEEAAAAERFGVEAPWADGERRTYSRCCGARVTERERACRACGQPGEG